MKRWLFADGADECQDTRLDDVNLQSSMTWTLVGAMSDVGHQTLPAYVRVEVRFTILPFPWYSMYIHLPSPESPRDAMQHPQVGSHGCDVETNRPPTASVSQSPIIGPLIAEGGVSRGLLRRIVHSQEWKR